MADIGIKRFCQIPSHLWAAAREGVLKFPSHLWAAAREGVLKFPSHLWGGLGRGKTIL